MKRLSTHVIAVAAVLFGFAAATARADTIWSYQVSGLGSSSGIPRVYSTSSPPEGQIRGGIELRGESAASAYGSSDIVLVNLSAFSTASPSQPDVFAGAGYRLTLTLTEATSNKSGTLTSTGFFDGTLSASSSNLSNTFTGATTQTLVLGDNTYEVTIGPFAPPGPPTSGLFGAISAHVRVENHAPEPSSLVLGGLGLSFLGLASWRKWRRRPSAHAVT
jgi:hypothetical protein